MTIKMVAVTEILTRVASTADGYSVQDGAHEWFRLMWNKLRDSQTPAIIRAIEEQGFTDPICIEEDYGNTWRLGNGHHRLAIAILLGLDEIPVDFSSWMSASSLAHSDNIRKAWKEADCSLSSWIADTAVSRKDMSEVDYF